MTEQDEQPYEPGGRRRKRRGVPGCLAVLVALAVIGGLGYIGVTKGIQVLKDKFASAPDYPGPGSGKVLFEVKQGDLSGDMCRSMKSDGVVASVDACIAAANANTKSQGIQVGYYRLKKQMAAADAIAVLTDPGNILSDAVTVPEGLRVVDVVNLLAKHTDFSAAQYNKVLADPSQLGLPDYANDNPEGYLFPATYGIGPKDQPLDILKMMVQRWQQAADDAHLETEASKLGYTPAELMTVASLVQAEGRGSDMPKIARVIYNRVENPDNGETNGLLQVDATVNYALHRKGVVAVTTDETQNTDSPYNTYLNPGLPPGPIEAPGDDAIRAAAHPASGSWLYYVTVNLKTGETKFADDYNTFLQYKQEYQQYCTTSDAC
jgi:UPF0755 protein